MKLPSSYTTLLILIFIGGSLVLLSYLYAIKTYSGNVNDFWGGFPKQYLSVYYVSMLVSAVSFFIFTSYILLQFDMLTERHIFKVVFPVLYTILLIGSAIWMPSVKLYLIDAPSFLWIFIRTILFSVGFSSLVMTVVLFITKPNPISTHYVGAVVASSYFCFHTLILDGFVWPHFFK